MHALKYWTRCRLSTELYDACQPTCMCQLFIKPGHECCCKNFKFQDWHKSSCVNWHLAKYNLEEQLVPETWTILISWTVYSKDLINLYKMHSKEVYKCTDIYSLTKLEKWLQEGFIFNKYTNNCLTRQFPVHFMTTMLDIFKEICLLHVIKSSISRPKCNLQISPNMTKENVIKKHLLVRWLSLSKEELESNFSRETWFKYSFKIWETYEFSNTADVHTAQSPTIEISWVCQHAQIMCLYNLCHVSSYWVKVLFM